MRGDLLVFLRKFLVLITCKQSGPLKAGNNNRASLFQALPFLDQISYFVADKGILENIIVNCGFVQDYVQLNPKIICQIISQEFQS